MAGLKRGSAPKGHTNMKTGANLPSTPAQPRAANGGYGQPAGRTGKGKMPPGGTAPGMPGHN